MARIGAEKQLQAAEKALEHLEMALKLTGAQMSELQEHIMPDVHKLRGKYLPAPFFHSHRESKIQKLYYFEILSFPSDSNGQIVKNLIRIILFQLSYLMLTVM